ncbi:MAG: S-layer homology domain-containing protein [Clostridia bacterium]|nr:S-layer homology domain-containing protein [Clostridia bacterium]
MKKIIGLLSAVSIIFTVSFTAFAVETVGGQITLTQFLGVSRGEAEEVSIYTNAMEKAEKVDINKFYDIADNMLLTSSLDPQPVNFGGIYIAVIANDIIDGASYISPEGGVDRALPGPGRRLYALYTVDNTEFIEKLRGLLPDNGFSDIKGHWAEETILKFKDKDIISGYTDGTFKPDNQVTRAELAKILSLAFELKKEEAINYSDVDASAWYYPYLECAGRYIPVYKLPVSCETNMPYAELESQGLNGFLPGTYALRMHVAETLVKIKQEKDNPEIALPEILDIQESLRKTFKDGDYEELFAMHGTVPQNVRRMFEYTWLANELGVMQGDADGYFRPYNYITRAELLTVIDRVLEK